MTTETQSLDEQIGALLFGWTPECDGLLSVPSWRSSGQWLCECGYMAWPGQMHPRPLRPYSTARALVWDVVDQMRERGWDCTISVFANDQACVAVFTHRTAYHDSIVTPQATVEANTVPEAVCRAALQALEYPPADKPGSCP